MGIWGKGKAWALNKKTQHILKTLFRSHYREGGMMAHPDYLAKDLCSEVWDINSEVFESQYPPRPEVCAVWAIAFGLSKVDVVDDSLRDVFLICMSDLMIMIKHESRDGHVLYSIEKNILSKTTRIVLSYHNDMRDYLEELGIIGSDTPWRVDDPYYSDSGQDSLRRVRAATAQFRLFNPDINISIIINIESLGSEDRFLENIGRKKVLSYFDKNRGRIFLIAENIPKGLEMEILLKTIESQSSVYVD